MEQNTEWLKYYFPYLSIPLFIAAWIGLVKLISYWDGWHNLAEYYMAPWPFSGELFRFQSAGMRRGTSFTGCLIAGADPQGLYLSLILPFRPGHPPLFIPWGEISGRPESKGWMATVRLKFEKYPSAPIWITKPFADKLSHASGFQLIHEEGI